MYVLYAFQNFLAFCTEIKVDLILREVRRLRNQRHCLFLPVLPFIRLPNRHYVVLILNTYVIKIKFEGSAKQNEGRYVVKCLFWNEFKDK